MRSRLQRGFIDPLSLIGLGFLVVSIVVGAAVVRNRNVNMDIRKKAATTCIDPCQSDAECATGEYCYKPATGCPVCKTKITASPIPEATSSPKPTNSPIPTSSPTPLPYIRCCPKDNSLSAQNTCPGASENACKINIKVCDPLYSVDPNAKCKSTATFTPIPTSSNSPMPKPTSTKTPMPTLTPVPTAGYSCTLASGQWCSLEKCSLSEGECSGSGTCSSGRFCCKACPTAKPTSTSSPTPKPTSTGTALPKPTSTNSPIPKSTYTPTPAPKLKQTSSPVPTAIPCTTNDKCKPSGGSCCSGSETSSLLCFPSFRKCISCIPSGSCKMSGGSCCSGSGVSDSKCTQTQIRCATLPSPIPTSTFTPTPKPTVTPIPKFKATSTPTPAPTYSPTPSPSPTISPSPTPRKASLVYYSQRDPQWQDAYFTCSDGKIVAFANKGCGETSVAMLLSTYVSGSYTPAVVKETWFTDPVYCGGTGISRLMDVLGSQGFSFRRGVSETALKDFVRSGSVALVTILFDGVEHQTIATGVDGNGNFIFMDPWFGPNSTPGVGYEIMGSAVIKLPGSL